MTHIDKKELISFNCKDYINVMKNMSFVNPMECDFLEKEDNVSMPKALVCMFLAPE